MLGSMLHLDVVTLWVVLFWGNVVSVALILAYWFYSGAMTIIARYLLPAKICQAVAYFLILYRDVVPDAVSVNIGNSMLFVGFYLEARVMFALVKENRRWETVEAVLLAVCLLFFNIMELVRPSPSMRVVTASLSVVSILLVPAFRLFKSRNTTPFKRAVAGFYICFLMLLLPRAYLALMGDVSIFHSSEVQSLTYLAQVLLLIFSLSAYLLLMKEDADKIIRDMATTDYLTRLPNRYSFLDAADRVFNRLRVDGRSVAMLFFDIDYFKSINDTYGHSFGDQVLVALGKLVRDSLRPTDLSCRYGGEEFVIMLPGATKVTGLKVGERLRMEVKELRFPGQPDFGFTISVGVMDGVPGGDDSLELFINQADSALYAAKKGGRDQVVEYDPVRDFLSDI